MQPRLRNAYFLLAALLIAVHFLGRWLMSLYGLDPPYVYFNVGMLLYLGSMGAGIVLALVVFAHIIKNARNR